MTKPIKINFSNYIYQTQYAYLYHFKLQFINFYKVVLFKYIHNTQFYLFKYTIKINYILATWIVKILFIIYIMPYSTLNVLYHKIKLKNAWKVHISPKKYLYCHILFVTCEMSKNVFFRDIPIYLLTTWLIRKHASTL